MAKCALAMLTKCIVKSKHMVTKYNEKINVHGCDPGWISIDEYYENDRPWIIPPLDEVDGAARVLFPLFMSLPSEQKTRRHFTELLY